MPPTIPSRALPRPRLAALAALLLAAAPAAALAQAMMSNGEDESVQPVISQVYTVLPAARLEAARRADRAYVTGMRAHHAGALTMSREYLDDPAARSPTLRDLAHAIILNQRYEIALMDEVARQLDRPPTMLGRMAVQPAALAGTGWIYGYAKAPIPGPLTPLAPPGGAVTARDVQFARAMTIHHQGALEMARDYQADPDARNSFLGLLNVDIVTDQTQEIGIMRRVAAAFPGDADAVPIPPGMIHGMEGMSHGAHGAGSHGDGSHGDGSHGDGPHGDGAADHGGHAGHGAAAPRPAPRPAAAPSPRGSAPDEHRHHR